MPKTLPKPKERPGRELAPIDKAAQSDHRTPRATGQDASIAWAAWWDDLVELYDVVLVGTDGDYVKRVGRVHRQTISRTKWHHVQSLKQIPLLCLRQYLKQMEQWHPDNEITEITNGEPQQLLREQRRKVQRKRYRRHERQAAADYFGCAPEQVHSPDLRAYRTRGGEPAPTTEKE